MTEPLNEVHRSYPTQSSELPRTLSDNVTAAAFIALHLSVLSVFFVEFSWLWVGLAVFFYVIRGFGITAGYHRYFAHRAFKATRWFQFVLAFLGAAALQRGMFWWTAHHRMHHKYSDQEDDPHSPIVRSIAWSHIGWILSNRYSEIQWNVMRDFLKFPELVILEKLDLLPGILLGVGCFFAGYFGLGVEPGISGGLTGLVWGFVVSTVCLYHATFMVNSVCHLLGTRRFDTKDQSRNNWFVAFFTLGEGWHNNHHHYPAAARQGFKWWEYDFSYYVLKVLSQFGIVWDLRQYSPRAVVKNLAKH